MPNTGREDLMTQKIVTKVLRLPPTKGTLERLPRPIFLPLDQKQSMQYCTAHYFSVP
jgi:hypothetical protein